MVLLVLDASVIIKWFKEEIHSDIAVKIKEDFVNGIHEIIVPDLVLYELANAMRYSGSFDEKLSKESIDNLLQMELNIVIPSGDLISNAISFSYLHNVTIYDAIYMALSSVNRAIFVTADEKLHKSIKTLKFVKFISEMR